MKKTLLSSALVLGWLGTALAAPKMVTLPKADYQKILEQLQALQNRVEHLEHQSPSGKAHQAVNPNKLARDVENIYDTLDEVETKTLQDRINLGAELRTRVDNVSVKNHLYFSTGAQGTKESNDNSWTNRFRLNLDADILKNLTFTGRLTAYKNFADGDSANGDVLGDGNSAHLPDGSGIKLDRAYVDWVPGNMPFPLAITFGRHPSSEGPPLELKENRKRQSTYPALLFDGEADGVVATIGLERYTGLKNAGLRFAWGKAYQDDDDVSSYLDAPGGLDDTNVYAAFFESEIPGVDNSLMVFSALRADDLAADFTTLGITPSANLGDVDIFGAHFQANKVLNSQFDIFLSLGLDKTHPNGTTMAYGPYTLGLLNSDGTTSHSGWAVYTGLTYTLTSKTFNNPKLGFEYNHGSDYWFSFTSGSTELYNKLATRGDVYDVYYIQPLNKNLYARIGYTYANYDYALSGFHIGDFGPSEEELRNAYFLMDCRF